jgi:ATP-dependent Zn protease
MGSNWDFVRWLLENSRGTATVEIRNANNVLVNILLPLIPWLLIFGFIWFFVFRQLRKTSCIKTAQAVATGPGRWVPDEPGKAGQA